MSLLEYHTICVCSDKTNHTNFETYCQNIADLLIGTWLMCLRREHSISIVTKIDIRMLIATKNDYKIRYSKYYQNQQCDLWVHQLWIEQAQSPSPH